MTLVDSVWIEKSFSSRARALRKEFDQYFFDPRETHSKRFVWDSWHVPDHYSHLRTPAYHYFSSPLYQAFHKELVLWGRKNLGCWDISPPWLSCYVENHFQSLHTDVPHGPWAYVFSLSPARPRYQGGETLLAKPELLNYWSSFGKLQDREHSSFFAKIPSRFNQLLVFDPRIPHGVTPVKGVQDPREGRLVIHGWFTQPKTYVEGSLPPRSTEKILNQAFEQVQERLALVESSAASLIEPENVQGTLALGLRVSPAGKVLKTWFFSNGLRDQRGQTPQRLCRDLLKIYSSCTFGKSSGTTEITVPLIFS